MFANASPAVRIRLEGNAACDRAAIYAVNEAAFGTSDEANLVDRLRAEHHVLVSLVAELDSVIVGHILFSRMWINTKSGHIAAVALAPVAVLTTHQRKGIGGLLIRHGLELLRSRGESIVIVVGHPAYYPRFGFSTDLTRSIESPFSRQAFMAMELQKGVLDRIHGQVVYPPPFGIP